MKKYILNGKEIKFGDKISAMSKNGNTLVKFYGEFSKEVLNFLLENKLIKEDSGITKEDVVASFCNRNGFDRFNCLKFLNKLTEVSPIATTSLLLKEISIMMDKKYPGDYRKCKELYGVNSLDFSVFPFKPEEGMMLENVSSFRTAEDAVKALEIIFSDEIENKEC